MSRSGRQLVLTTSALAGCAGAPAAVAVEGAAVEGTGGAEPSPSTDVVVGACTAIGSAEGVGVDLTGVLDVEGGDCSAEVSVPGLGVSRTIGSAGDDSYRLVGGVEADLTSAPVTVVVVVRTEAGGMGHTAEDVVTPEPHQPNGPRCDGEDHRAELVATDGGTLEPRPDDPFQECTDAQGRTSIAIATR